jgi:hypothetical protein
MLLKGVIKLEDGKVTAVHNLTYGFDPASAGGGSFHTALTTLSAKGWKIEGNIDEATGQGKHELPISKEIELPFGFDDVETFAGSEGQVEVRLKNGIVMRIEENEMTEDIADFLRYSPTIKR